MNSAVATTLANIQWGPAPRPKSYPYRLPGHQGYDIVDLGTFNDPNGGAFDANSSVLPSDINNAGLVTGAEFLPTAGNVFAFSFTLAGGIVNLGTTANAGSNSLATGVNAGGQIAFMADRSGGGGGYVSARLAGGALTVLPLFTTGRVQRGRHSAHRKLLYLRNQYCW